MACPLDGRVRHIVATAEKKMLDARCAKVDKNKRKMFQKMANRPTEVKERRRMTLRFSSTIANKEVIS
jgi:hypothetical protein